MKNGELEGPTGKARAMLAAGSQVTAADPMHHKGLDTKAEAPAIARADVVVDLGDEAVAVGVTVADVVDEDVADSGLVVRTRLSLPHQPRLTSDKPGADS